MKTIDFNDFLQDLKTDELPIAMHVDGLFLQGGCKREIKAAASGFTVSYISLAAKKTVANFIFRKSGLKIRITPLKPFFCDDILSGLPENMKKDIVRASVCKKLSDASLCSPYCAMGYEFTLDGESYKKCRSMAFLFAVTEENFPYICNFVEKILV